MGLLGDLFDDAMSLPGKLVEGALSLPASVIEAARKAGCKTADEIQKFAEDLDDRMVP